MKRVLTWVVGVVLALGLSAGVGAYFYFYSKQPLREGVLALQHLQAPVQVRTDERGVPHILAQSELDAYRALGWVHAADRLFQMEMARRLANGELADVLGPKLIKVDKLFRTLGLRSHAAAQAAQLSAQDPAVATQLAYLDGVNQFVQRGATPVEFDLLGLPKRAFTLQDSLAVGGYLAYSFAAAFKTEPVLSAVRDQLGPDYLRVFDLQWHAQGVLDKPAPAPSAPNTPPNAPASPAAPSVMAPSLQGPLGGLVTQGLPIQVERAQTATAHRSARAPDAANCPACSAQAQVLSAWAEVSAQVQSLTGQPLLEGSNAWAVAGSRTESGRPILAGDPHIGFGVPQVWFEAHLSAPGFELYGHFQALIAHALLGFNDRFGWSLTMFQNDDMDLVRLQRNPANARQVQVRGVWSDIQVQEESIAVKGFKPIKLRRELTPYGPLIQSAFKDTLGDIAPIALWWTYQQTDNPLLQTFYALNRADTLERARAAASLLAAPGLNIVWANAAGDIGWWAAARLPIRPAGVNPSFILDEAKGEAEKSGFYRFADNPQEENPARGYIVSANHQPLSTSGLPIPGYYNLPDRAQALVDRLGNANLRWAMPNTQSLQTSTQTAYFWRVMGPLMPVLSESVHDPLERSVFDSLNMWDGQFIVQNVPPTVYQQFLYELVHLAMADELGDALFKSLLATRALDHALPRLAADALSPWWDDVRTERVETRQDIVRMAWRKAVAHLQDSLGKSPNDWGWGVAHTLTHQHPLALSWPLTWVFNVGPMAAPGGREVPNNLSMPLGPAPWAVSYGPSARRIIDFGFPDQARTIAPLGQSGVPFSAHYADQAPAFVANGYLPMYIKREEIRDNAWETLILRPDRATP